MFKFKKGDKVVITDKCLTLESNYGFNEYMERYIGDTITLRRKAFSIGGEDYAWKCDENGWTWDEKWLEPFKKKNEVYHSINDIEDVGVSVALDFLTNLLLFGIEDYKIVRNDMCVILVAERRGVSFKVKTKCHKDDEFDFEKAIKVINLKLKKREYLKKIESINKEMQKF